MTIIYCAINTTNNKCYVGKSARGIKYRKYHHLRDASRNSQLVFHRAIRKYGIEAFEWTVLKEVEDPDDLDVWERHFISKLKTKLPNGYNMTDGGDGGNTGIPTEETREKLRKASTGRKHSEKSKQKMRDAQKGVLLTDEIKAKISQTLKQKGIKPPSRLGILSTEESRQKASEANKGKPKPVGFGEKISAIKKGKPLGPCTEARKEKLRAHFTGRPWPESRCRAEMEKKKNAD